MNAPHVAVLGAVLAQPPSGVRRHAVELIARAAGLLVERGGRFTLLEGTRPCDFELPAGCERRSTPIPASPVWRRAWREARGLRRELARGGSDEQTIDVLHTGHLPIPPFASLSGTPLVVTLHDLRQLDPELVGALRARLGHRAYARVARDAQRIVFVSETMRRTFVERFDADLARTVVIPNAADHLDRIASTPLQGDLPATYLLHVGHLEPRKNLELLIRTLALDPELPPLVLAGAAQHGEDARLRQLADKLGVEQRVRFLPRFDDAQLVALYRGAACVVVPSRMEGFGLCAEEARRLERPLAVARAGALPEIAGAGVPTFSVDAPAETAAAIRRAVQAPPPERSDRTWRSSAEALVATWCEVARLR